MNFSSNLPDALTNAVLACISRSDYHVEPPKLSADLWDRVCILTSESKAENERLEFLGDALMDACFALEMYKQIPDGTPHMYTEIRSALHRNLAFCHLANKMGLTTTGHTKSIGDVFETLMGAYYTEKGFDGLYEWTRRTYEPVLLAAINAYYSFQKRFRARTPDEVEPSSYSETSSSPESPVTPKTPSQRKGKHRQTNSIPPASPIASSSTPSRIRAPQPSVRTASVREATPSPPPAPSTDDDADDVFQSFSSRVTVRDRPDLSPAVESPSAPPGYYFSSNLSSSQPPPSQSRAPNPRASPPVSLRDDRPLPEFWEELRMPDGRVVFVDHKHQVTTWDDPRNKTDAAAAYSSEELRVEEPDAWTARLVAPLHEVSPGQGWVPRYPSGDRFFEGTSSGHTLPSTSAAGGSARRELSPLPLHAPFPDLMQDGYILQDDDETAGSTARGASLSDFWEVRQGEDGHEYHIDHVNSTIKRQR